MAIEIASNPSYSYSIYTKIVIYKHLFSKKMKKTILCLTLITFVLLSCKHKRDKIEIDNKVSIFCLLPPDKSGNVKLWVNDSLIFQGPFIYQKDCAIYNDMLVGKIKKSNNVYKFKVNLLQSDTLFYYKMRNVDSIRISLHDNHFYICDNREKGKWLLD